jgi:flavin prenyltransferase
VAASTTQTDDADGCRCLRKHSSHCNKNDKKNQPLFLRGGVQKNQGDSNLSMKLACKDQGSACQALSALYKERIMKKIIVGISGASGTIYGITALKMLRQTGGIETHLVMSRAAMLTTAIETDFKAPDILRLADAHYLPEDIAAPIASGSFPVSGMIVAPCSMRTLGEIVSGVTSGLLSRAADVTLKERRPLVLMARETPLHLGHLRAMVAATEMGAVIAPPVPAFYNRPATLAEMVTYSTGRALDMLGVSVPGLARWQGVKE